MMPDNIAQDLDVALDSVVARLTPKIQEERIMLDLPSPEEISVKLEYNPSRGLACAEFDEDFIRINLAHIVTTEHGFTEEQAAIANRFGQFMNYVNTLVQKQPTLDGLDSFFTSQAGIKGLDFSHYDGPTRQHFEAVRSAILSKLGDAQRDIGTLMPLATEAIQSGRLDDYLLRHLRHEVEHYTSPNREAMRTLTQEYADIDKEIRPLLASEGLSKINWKKFADFSSRYLEHKIKTSAEEESMAFFFTFVPYAGWTSDAVDNASQMVKANVDGYNPGAFLVEALQYLVASENERRQTKGEKSLIHPGGNEVLYVVGKLSPQTHSTLNQADPTKTDMDFVSRVLYTDLPQIQGQYSQISGKIINRNQANLKTAIAK